MEYDVATILRTMNLPKKKDYPSLPPRVLDEPKNFITNDSRINRVVDIQSTTPSMVSGTHWKFSVGYRTPQSDGLEVIGEGRSKVSHRTTQVCCI